MTIRKASPTTDQCARSLLQKAVRRANVELVQAVFRYLKIEKRDNLWLRSRLAVMVFEEAWPYGVDVTFDRDENSLLRHYDALCRSSKNKDAAGLGSLAYALAEGDASVLGDNEGDWHIRVIAKAIEARAQFWEWINSETVNADSGVRFLVKRAEEGSKKAGWPWDKAFMYAAALLATRQPIPTTKAIVPPPAREFPYWIAIDKHTAKGKEVLRAIAKENKIRANIVRWLSFYLESGVSAGLVDSPWWEREKQWRFAKLGLKSLEATDIWNRLRNDVAEQVQGEAQMLASRIGRYVQPELRETRVLAGEQDPQPSLFS